MVLARRRSPRSAHVHVAVRVNVNVRRAAAAVAAPRSCRRANFPTPW